MGMYAPIAHAGSEVICMTDGDSHRRTACTGNRTSAGVIGIRASFAAYLR